MSEPPLVDVLEGDGGVAEHLTHHLALVRLALAPAVQRGQEVGERPPERHRRDGVAELQVREAGHEVERGVRQVLRLAEDLGLRGDARPSRLPDVHDVGGRHEVPRARYDTTTGEAPSPRRSNRRRSREASRERATLVFRGPSTVLRRWIEPRGIATSVPPVSTLARSRSSRSTASRCSETGSRRAIASTSPRRSGSVAIQKDPWGPRTTCADRSAPGPVKRTRWRAAVTAG